MSCAVCSRFVTADGLAVISATVPSFRLVEQLRLLEVGAAQLDVGLAGEAGDADIGLRRLGDRRQPVDFGFGYGDRRDR